ncbi:hypothetical protein DXG03_007627 [Asterophora parasitica]|uniref:Neutral protease 2 n=1 Tax=Asterophora parasitica TaxID=117018 RepID=A0A9P7KDF1_9AGAR|nr:hypothetical protein DXG03_007627 [Asterophora parasitica]
MLFSSFVALGLASVAFATPSKRFDGLTVELSGPPDTVHSVSNLKFKAVVKNGGSEDVKIFKYSTILDDRLPTKSFSVTKDGKTVPFRGVKLQVNLDVLDDRAFTLIPAGGSVTVNHDVASLFDFSSVGAGTFSFQPIADFRLLGAKDEVKGVESFSKVQVASNNMVIKVSRDVSKRELPRLEKRADVTCTNTWKRNFIEDSYGVCSNGVIAYTVASTTNIYYCDLFFKEVSTITVCSTTTVAARNLRSGTTLHELTHAVANTDDISYGCSANKQLSEAQAVINADNYNCFASQVYKNTRCG